MSHASGEERDFPPLGPVPLPLGLDTNQEGHFEPLPVAVDVLVASAAALFSLARGVIELREARAERFSGDAAMELYLTARQRFALACLGAAACTGPTADA